MEEIPVQGRLFNKFSKLIRSGSIIDLIAKLSDYTFMIVSLPIVGTATLTLLDYINEDSLPIINRSVAVLFTILFFLLSYFLNRKSKTKNTNRKLTFDDWFIKIFLQTSVFTFYFLYSASLTALLLAIFQSEFGLELQSKIRELLPEVMQFYFFLLFIALPVTVLIIFIAAYISIKGDFENAKKNKRILVGFLLCIPFLFLQYFLENFDYTTIDVDKALKIGTLLVGPLIIYIIRILFFRKWIKLEQ